MKICSGCLNVIEENLADIFSVTRGSSKFVYIWKTQYMLLCCVSGVVKGGKQENSRERTILGHKSAQNDNDSDDDDWWL